MNYEIWNFKLSKHQYTVYRRNKFAWHLQLLTLHAILSKGNKAETE
jgi:hypothetical protein